MRGLIICAAALLLVGAPWTPATSTVLLDEERYAWSSFTGPGVDGEIRAAVLWDDGRGPAVYVGGDFVIGRSQTSDGSTIRHLARWDGIRFEPVGGAVDGPIEALFASDQGLIVGGNFSKAADVVTSNIARWDGATWTALGDGAPGPVMALAEFEGVLHAGGEFPVSEAAVIRFDGMAWEPVGASASGPEPVLVRALQVFEGALIAGGTFSAIGGVAASHLASWNGQAWSEFGGGVDGGIDYQRYGRVDTLAVYDGALIVGGSFSSADGQPWVNLAAWKAGAWTAVGNSQPLGPVLAILVIDGQLVIGGAFTSFSNGTTFASLARLSGTLGTAWQFNTGRLNPDAFGVRALAPHSYGTGFVAAGRFLTSTQATGSSVVNGVANCVFGTEGCVPVIEAPAGGFALQTANTGGINAIAADNDGFWVAGQFHAAGSALANNVARWDGMRWHAIDDGSTALSGTVYALAAHGDTMVAGGDFAVAPLSARTNVAQLQNGAWSSLASGLNGYVHALSDFQGELIAGGEFSASRAGVEMHGAARWDGNSWNAFGSFLPGSLVFALHVFDGQLFAAGRLFLAQDTQPAVVARWDGSEWLPHGAALGGVAWALTDDDAALLVGGLLTVDEEQTGVARCTQDSCVALGTGGPSSRVQSLARVGDGVLAGVRYTSYTNTRPSDPLLWYWNGEQWQVISTLGDTKGSVNALLGIGADVAIGGTFDQLGSEASGRFSILRRVSIFSDDFESPQ